MATDRLPTICLECRQPIPHEEYYDHARACVHGTAPTARTEAIEAMKAALHYDAHDSLRNCLDYSLDEDGVNAVLFVALSAIPPSVKARLAIEEDGLEHVGDVAWKSTLPFAVGAELVITNNDRSVMRSMHTGQPVYRLTEEAETGG